MSSAGVFGFYEYFEEPTAQCLVLVNGKNRSLVTEIGAANLLTSDILDTDECKGALNTAELFYIAGFSLSLKQQIINSFVTASENKTLILNLSAPFVCEKFSDSIYPLIEQSNYVFGNESEVKAFVEAKGINQTEDDVEAANYFAREFFKKDSEQTLIVTRGDKSILMITKDTLEEIEVPVMDAKYIKDTNGAGDAFVGGFISKLAEGKSKKECVEYGVTIAQLILTQVGCTLPGTDSCTHT